MNRLLSGVRTWAKKPAEKHDIVIAFGILGATTVIAVLVVLS